MIAVHGAPDTPPEPRKLRKVRVRARRLLMDELDQRLQDHDERPVGRRIRSRLVGGRFSGARRRAEEDVSPVGLQLQRLALVAVGLAPERAKSRDRTVGGTLARLAQCCALVALHSARPRLVRHHAPGAAPIGSPGRRGTIHAAEAPTRYRGSAIWAHGI